MHAELTSVSNMNPQWPIQHLSQSHLAADDYRKVTMRPLIASMALTIVFPLTGCSTGPSEPVTTPDHSASASPQTEPEAPEALEALIAFSKIAEASCDKAEAEGTIQTVNDMTQVMLPKGESVDGYSAAYVAGIGKPEIIYETYGFLACMIHLQISMAVEAGISLEEQVQREDAVFAERIDDNTWNVTTSVGSMDGKPLRLTDKYIIVDGLIAQVSYLGEGEGAPETVTDIKYSITDKQRQIVSRAVEASRK